MWESFGAEPGAQVTLPSLKEKKERERSSRAFGSAEYKCDLEQEIQFCRGFHKSSYEVAPRKRVGLTRFANGGTLQVACQSFLFFCLTQGLALQPKLA